MSFKKLNTAILETLEALEYTSPLPFQEQCLSLIKGGADLFLIAPEGAGKTAALIISVMRKLEGKSIGDNPRAVIFVKDKAAADELALRFEPFARKARLRTFVAIDKHKLQGQIDMMYDGIDILIGTPKRIKKLFLNNGFNLAELKILIVEDAEQVLINEVHSDIVRVKESMPKGQSLVFAQTMKPKFQVLKDTFMERARVISAPPTPPVVAAADDLSE